MRAARTDGNQTTIVAALRKAGRTVAVTSKMGDGFPDLVVGSPYGRVLLVEIKDEDPARYGGPYSPSRHVLLTGDQPDFHRRWATAIPIVFTIEEALKVTR